MARMNKRGAIASHPPPASSNPRTNRSERAHGAAIPEARFLLFGGKGGVGKTTAACAAALLLFDRAGGDESILLLSTDPAHSLSDSLGVEIGDEETAVADRGRARLVAREIDAGAALERFKRRHLATIAEIADRGTILDESDINDLLNLSLPGLDEVMALFELSEVATAGDYSRVVIDTAPSGHTSRLLAMPEVFTGWIGALDRLQEKHRFMVARLGGGARSREDRVETFLRDMRGRVAGVRRVIYDAALSSFTLVTIPEAMAVEETARYLNTLRSAGVPVTDLVVNRIERGRDGCRYCRARASFQKPWLNQLGHDFSSLRTHKVPLLPFEVRGPERLREFARIAWLNGRDAASPGRGDATIKADLPAHRSELRMIPVAASPRPLIIFGGKGGVGKTTAAAAAALAIARSDPSARVLLFSTDPAHSLSDSFRERVGEFKSGVGGQANLDAMEIDPAAWLDALKNRFRERVDDLFESLTAGSRWQIQFDREAMREVVELAPPGIDEIAALSRVSNLVEENRYRLIVLDTAPTGHLVRFLELPEVALSWVRAFMKLLLKYKDVVRWEGLAEELIALSKSIKRVLSLLTDGGECEFVGVAIAERMSLEETARLAASLERLGVPLRRLLINNVVPSEAASGCEFCAARLAAQQQVIRSFKKEFGRGVEILMATAQPREVRGRKRLREHFDNWRSATETDERRKSKKGRGQNG